MPLPDATLPPSTPVQLYERIDKTVPGYNFYAHAHPVGERAVYAFGDDAEKTVARVQSLLDA